MAAGDSDGKGYILPEVIDPAGSKCVSIPVPNDRYHIAAFWGALWTLGAWYNWERDSLKQGKDAAAVWQDIIAAARVEWDNELYCPGNSWCARLSFGTGNQYNFAPFVDGTYDPSTLATWDGTGFREVRSEHPDHGVDWDVCDVRYLASEAHNLIWVKVQFFLSSAPSGITARLYYRDLDGGWQLLATKSSLSSGENIWEYYANVQARGWRLKVECEPDITIKQRLFVVTASGNDPYGLNNCNG